MSRQVILGMDGGGTYTRIAITDTDGNLLSYVENKAASSIHKDLQAKQNVHNTIVEAACKANCNLGDIVGVTAGVAGLDSERDLEWACELTRVDGLDCASQHVNDTVAAHHGAFLSKPGIIAISGTGSNIFCITEGGKQISNYAFHHYAATAARFLVYDTVYKIIAGETDWTDDELISRVLAHFDVKDLVALTKMGCDGFAQDKRARDKQFGQCAPIITDTALKGSHLAMEICNQAAAAIVTGIQLLGSCFEIEKIPVALIGGVANSTYINNTIREMLGGKTNREYFVVEPVFPAVLGAVLMAMELNGIALNDQILSNLHKGAEMIANHL